jgi:hypothetical protein
MAASHRRAQVGFRVLASVLCLCSAATLARDRQQVSDDLLLHGRVIDAATGDPIAEAAVSASAVRPSSFGGVPLVTSDSRGLFSVKVTFGVWVLSATKSGYLPGSVGQRRPGDEPVPIHISSGRSKEALLLIRLWRAAEISGRVLDSHSMPVPGITIRALHRRFIGGHEIYSFGRSSRTNDLGEYSIDDLQPSTYLIAALASTGTGAGIGLPSVGLRHPTTFYPGSYTYAGALPLTLGVGEHRSGVDLELRQVSTRQVSGTVMGSDGDMRRLRLRLIPVGEADRPHGLEVTQTSPNGDGRFVFERVPVGRYVIGGIRYPTAPRADGRPAVFQAGDGSRWIGRFGAELPEVADVATDWTRSEIDVGETDPPGLAVQLHRGASIAGSVIFEGTRKPSVQSLHSTGVLVLSANGRDLGSFAVARLESDAGFRTVEQQPGSYLVRLLFPQSGWFVKSMQANGRDILCQPLEVAGSGRRTMTITVTDRPTVVSGTVRNSDGSPATGSAVHLFPADSSCWKDFGPLPYRFRNVRTSDQGMYHFDGVPPGEYFLAAPTVESDIQHTPESLQGLSKIALRIVLRDGSSLVQDLTTKRIP